MKFEVLYKRTTQGLHFEMHFIKLWKTYYQIGKHIIKLESKLSNYQIYTHDYYFTTIPLIKIEDVLSHELTCNHPSYCDRSIVSESVQIHFISMPSSCPSCPSPALLPKACRCLPCVVRWLDNLYGSRRGCCCCRLQRHNSCSRLFESNHRYSHCSVCWSGSSS